MKNKNGFTLIEILAVIIIIGVVMLIAVPAVSNYINSSRKSAYITTAKEYIKEAQSKIATKDYELYDKNATYYIDIKNLPLESGGDSPFGDWVEAYVVVIYLPPDGYKYYWTSIDSSGFKVDLTEVEELDEDDIYNSEDGYLNNREPVGTRNNVVLVND